MKQQTCASFPSSGRLKTANSCVTKLKYDLWHREEHLQCKAEYQTFNGNDVVLPDHLVEHVDAFVDVLAFARVGKFVNEEIAKGTQVAAQPTGADSFDAGIRDRIDALRLKKLFPENAQKEAALVFPLRLVGEMSWPIVRVHARHSNVFLFDNCFQLLLRLSGWLVLRLIEELGQRRRETFSCDARPTMRSLLLDQRQKIPVPSAVLGFASCNADHAG